VGELIVLGQKMIWVFFFNFINIKKTLYFCNGKLILCLFSCLMNLAMLSHFLVREKVALTHVKQQQCIWMELSNAFDCVSQKENIRLNTENKRIIGVLTGLEFGRFKTLIKKRLFSRRTDCPNTCDTYPSKLMLKSSLHENT
jgi:hypothetical protein